MSMSSISCLLFQLSSIPHAACVLQWQGLQNSLNDLQSDVLRPVANLKPVSVFAIDLSVPHYQYAHVPV